MLVICLKVFRFFKRYIVSALQDLFIVLNPLVPSKSHCRIQCHQIHIISGVARTYYKTSWFGHLFANEYIVCCFTNILCELLLTCSSGRMCDIAYLIVCVYFTFWNNIKSVKTHTPVVCCVDKNTKGAAHTQYIHSVFRGLYHYITTLDRSSREEALLYGFVRLYYTESIIQYQTTFNNEEHWSHYMPTAPSPLVFFNNNMQCIHSPTLFTQ